MLITFALTVASIAVWFVVVFRQLHRARRAAFAPVVEQIVESFGLLIAATTEANAAMVSLARSMRDTMAHFESTLSPKQREIYDELRGIGVYPLDAMHEACARWPD